jgi:hypothetical protein
MSGTGPWLTQVAVPITAPLLLWCQAQVSAVSGAPCCALTAQDVPVCSHPICKFYSLIVGLQIEIHTDCSPQVLIHSRCNGCV